MARPRKAALTDDQKLQRKATKKAANDELAALQWGSRMPLDPDMRKGAFDVLRKAEQEVDQAKRWAEQEYDLPGARKRLSDVHGWHAAVLTFDKKMAGLTDGERSRVWRQMQRRAIDAAWDAQGDLFDLDDVGRIAEDTGSVFDETSAGEAHAAERTDDPGRARRRRRSSVEAPAPTPGIPLDEAEAAFEDANARRKTRRQRRAEPQEFDNEDDTVVAMPKRRGRPAMSEEEKAAAKARRDEAKRLEKLATSETADRYVADQERRLSNGSHEVAAAGEESGPPQAPVEEDDEPTGKYALL